MVDQGSTLVGHDLLITTAHHLGSSDNDARASRCPSPVLSLSQLSLIEVDSKPQRASEIMS